MPLRRKNMPNAHLAYRPDIDGLRALAVIAVVIFHLDAAHLPGGFVGVDIFFTISGYVVTASLLKQPCKGGLAAFFGNFYARRLKRLGPALVLVALTTGIGLCMLIRPIHPAVKAHLLTGMLAMIMVFVIKD